MWPQFKRLMTFLILILAGWYALKSDLVQNYLIPQVNEFLTSEENAETESKRTENEDKTPQNALSAPYEDQ